MSIVLSKIFPRSKTLAIFFAIAFVVSQACIVFILGPTSDLLLELQFSFSPSHFYDVLQKTSNEQRAALLHHFYLDFTHPLIYGAALFFWLKTLRQHQTFAQAWLILPWIASIADLLENCLELFLFTHLDHQFPAAVIMATSFSVLKWFAAFGSLLGIVIFSWRPARVN